MERQPHTSGRPRRGFTLVELLVVIGIILLVTTMAVAGFMTMVRGRTVAAAAHGIRTVLWQARSYAAGHNVEAAVMFYSSPRPRAEIYWHPLGAPADFNTANLTRERLVTKPYYLSRGVRYYYTANDGANQVRDLNEPTLRLVVLGAPDSTGTNDGNAIVFSPSGSIVPIGSNNNRQIGVVSPARDEVKAVKILAASGLPYMEEATP